MKIYLRNQAYRWEKHLDFFKTQPVMAFDKTRLTEKITTIALDIAEPIHRLHLDFLFDYHIFPGHIMRFYTQWKAENRNMQPGDTIVQQAHIPPVPVLSQKIIMAVRISGIIDEEHRKGFSYETVEGHVEKGISTFTVENINGQLQFKIHTFSTPGHWISKLAGPVFSVPYQAYCTRSALKYVKRQTEEQKKR